jgi:hypothetical protein
VQLVRSRDAHSVDASGSHPHRNTAGDADLNHDFNASVRATSHTVLG